MGILGGEVEKIIELGRRRVFTLDEVQNVVSIVNKITKVYSQQVDALIRQIDAIGTQNEDRVIALEGQVNELVEQWQKKVEKLGGLTRGLWLADFDSGSGYFCWKYPEERIEYWHAYSDGFSGRIRLNCENHSHVAKEPLVEVAKSPEVGL